jgi:hypothetical protein
MNFVETRLAEVRRVKFVEAEFSEVRMQNPA